MQFDSRVFVGSPSSPPWFVSTRTSPKMIGDWMPCSATTCPVPSWTSGEHGKNGDFFTGLMKHCSYWIILEGSNNAKSIVFLGGFALLTWTVCFGPHFLFVCLFVCLFGWLVGWLVGFLVVCLFACCCCCCCWLLVVGCWLLVVGCWLLVGCCYRFTPSKKTWR